MWLGELAANSEEPGVYAVSELGLHCLPMSHKKDARLVWVNICLYLFQTRPTGDM